MDIQRFEKILREPDKTRSDLQNMKDNALKKGEIEMARLAEEVLKERFPVVSRRGGATPTAAVFRGDHKNFDSGKEAYLWLIKQHQAFDIKAIENYIALHKKSGSKSKRCRFAQNPHDLYPKGSTRIDDTSQFSTLQGGWYVDTNLNHKDKFATLIQLSYVCGLEYPKDWDFVVTGGTEELQQYQKIVIRGNKLLDELLAL
ncbi:hypothetical protein [Methylobacillus flagellatus]|uniref:hypothetical protein n=1 Tax=Methylobacillus flagellatus TaxID=405 RepID=UPI0010F54B9D|nr:hypothetical protein [Methylobacillus flagellatus]